MFSSDQVEELALRLRVQIPKLTISEAQEAVHFLLSQLGYYPVSASSKSRVLRRGHAYRLELASEESDTPRLEGIFKATVFALGGKFEKKEQVVEVIVAAKAARTRKFQYFGLDSAPASNPPPESPPPPAKKKKKIRGTNDPGPGRSKAP